ncbi:unnamed protein product [Adineta steineri]|uniref:Uncharacterized protein n=1 Tax=Adineta steineri TaxID=433720 RepID=A0A814AX23_9BILA|nr:unnamed protein product [Adineta steineri]
MDYNLQLPSRKKRRVLTTPPHSNEPMETNYERSDDGSYISTQLQLGIQSVNPLSFIATEFDESALNSRQKTWMDNSFIDQTGPNDSFNIPQGSGNSSIASYELSPQVSNTASPANEHRSQNSTNQDGYLSVPIMSDNRFRYESDLANKTETRTSKITFMLNETKIVFGPSSAFSGGYAQITLLARKDETTYILSPHNFFDSTMDPKDIFFNPKYVPIVPYRNDITISGSLIIALSRQSDFISTSHCKGKASTYSKPVFTTEHYPSGRLEDSTGMKPRQLFRDYRLNDMYLGIRPASPNPNGGFSVEPDAPIIYSNCFSHAGQKKINLNDEQYKFQISNIITNVTDSPYPSTLQWSITCDVKVPEMYHCALTSGYLWLEMKIKKLTRASLTLLSADWSTPDKIYFNIDNKAHKFSFNIIVSDQNSADVPVNNENPLFSLHLTMCHVEKGTNIRNVFENSITKLNGAYSENRLELSMAN